MELFCMPKILSKISFEIPQLSLSKLTMFTLPSGYAVVLLHAKIKGNKLFPQ